MKKLILITVILTISAVLFSQKVQVQVVSESSSADKRWQILDENYIIAFQGSEYFNGDTIAFALESDKRYFFYFSSGVFPLDTLDLYTIILNGEPLLRIRSDVDAGDHFLPFFTGVRSGDTKITGGTDALISEFPWQVYITAGETACGGTIISGDWIVTAAHCVLTDAGAIVPASQVLVKAGANNPFNPDDGDVYQAIQVIVHENYSDNTNENDIALIRLRSSITTPIAESIGLLTPEDASLGAIDPGVMTWVTGWGLTSVNPRITPTRLQKVQLPIISRTQAMTVWRNIPVTDIMAGYKDGNMDACIGDSGGPMVVSVIGEYKLAGIVSWGSGLCNTYGAYTNVSLFVAWIRQKTGIVALFKPPTPQGDTLVCSGELSDRYSVTAVAGIEGYEWILSPSSAGNVSGTSTSVNVIWNPSFTGLATINYRVRIDGNYSQWSRLPVRVVENTRFIRQSADTAVCTGKPVTLAVQAEGHDLIFNWYRNETLVKTGPDSNLTFPSPSAGNTGIYNVTITGSCGTARSGSMSLVVYPLTEIDNVSGDASIRFGNDHTFSVSASGHNLNYQWFRDSVIIPEATGPSLLIDNANAADIGNYSITVSGTCGIRKSRELYFFVEGEPETGGPGVYLWPSVTSSAFNIAVDGDELYNINIYDSGGRLIASHTRLQYRNIISISSLSPGLYIVTVFNDDFRESIKVIKI